MSEPEWLEILRRECAATSQRKVSGRLGVSTGMVNAALRGRYPASTANLEQKVLAELAHKTVVCPVLDFPILLSRCKANQTITLSAPGAHFFREACPKCPHGGGKKR